MFKMSNSNCKMNGVTKRRVLIFSISCGYSQELPVPMSNQLDHVCFGVKNNKTYLQYSPQLSIYLVCSSCRQYLKLVPNYKCLDEVLCENQGPVVQS